MTSIDIDTLNPITIDARAIAMFVCGMAMFVCGMVVGYFIWGLK
jgi:hypothetical protein